MGLNRIHQGNFPQTTKANKTVAIRRDMPTSPKESLKNKLLFPSQGQDGANQRSKMSNVSNMS
jgi:hypothetical protein